MKSVAIITTVLLLLLSLISETKSSKNECKAWLVQSIPTDMPHLPLLPGVLPTSDVFKWLAGNATYKLDIMAQYWQFVAGPNNSLSGDYGYSEEDMQRFGAQEGLGVYKAIENAANRSVVVRLLQHSGVYPDYTNEPSDLATAGPNVTNVTLLLSQWWGSGIIHAKVWISDDRHMYIGSANNDWKSLTQVKELGIYIADCPKLAKKVRKYYDNLWTLASLNASLYTTTVWDSVWQLNRTVPCWSHFIAKDDRCDSPLSDDYVKVKHVSGYPPLSDPEMFKKPFQTPGCNITIATQRYSSYLSFAPPELSFDEYQTDEQGWVDTIKSVGNGAVVRISTMDFLGQSQFTDKTVYWSALSSAISEVVFSKQATVKLLVARWAHFINGTDEYLKSLLYTNVLCRSSKYNHCFGKVEIKYYEVPGYNATGPALINGNTTDNLYPSYSRVNHGKYAVSDVRAHIGTSNLVWDYFYTTAGVGVGTYNPNIVSQLQQVFDADWYSPYAFRVQPLDEGYTYSS
ncbi:hypothetical protein RND81_03G125300 [Saponaria officinalis]|uniref:PLD phosphodiesterase domain-containing protein n=1 Tax=Saponaria officinalis TaxID=3572 RepID=A0AAW1LZT5_SAPOF